MPDSPHSPGPKAPAPQSPPDFNVHGVNRMQFAAWRSHPVTLAWRQYLTDVIANRKAIALDAVLADALTPEMQTRVAAVVEVLTEMADPQFDDLGLFYGLARPSQEEWDATRAQAQEEGVEIDDPYAEEEENDD